MPQAVELKNQKKDLNELGSLGEKVNVSDWSQTTVTLRPHGRGFHLITYELVEAFRN